MSMKTLAASLKEYFGFNTFRPHQEDIVKSIMLGEDVVAILPTGSGKSLCYQLPAVINDGTAIVISPLISLMQDQVLQLTKMGIAAECINSMNKAGESAMIMHEFDAFKLIYIAPERLSTPGFVDELKRKKISLFVIDEAHCISQWGHSFRPEYRQLTRLKDEFPDVPIASFTATATNDVEKDISSQLKLRAPIHIKGSFDRDNLLLKIHEKTDYKTQLNECLSRHKGESGIIYCSTRKKVDTVYEMLEKRGWNVDKYHAGLSDVSRQKALENFIHEETDVIVATVAFGMGINKPNVRFVFHTDMPQNIENYYQEIGRAGRDGLPAECVMLFSLRDIIMQKKFLDDIPNPSIRIHQKRKSDQLLAMANSIECRRKDLLSYFGEVYEKRCENCDNCLDDVEQMDGTIIAQKILSCVYRLHQSFGMTYVMDVLKGSQNKAVLQRRHDQLSTYALLKDCSKHEIRHYMLSLINQGYLFVTDGEYPILNLTEKSKEILYEKKEVFFRNQIVKGKNEGSVKKGRSVIHIDESDQPLYMKLKELRKNIADKQNVPPYFIFNDKTLMEIAHVKPSNDDALLLINGVGEQKLRKYGELFLLIVRQFG